MARKKKKIIYKYNCTITDEEFKTTKEAKTPDDLISISAYYEMNPEMDDRPADIKKKLGIVEE